MAEKRRIVVGVDGSARSDAALIWAADEARRREATLEVVTAWQDPVAYYGAASPAAHAASSFTDVVEARAEQIADHAARRAADLVADVVHQGVQGQAAEVLTEAAEGADLLVVGSRGRGGFTSLVLGSVGSECAQHAPCPVAVVR
jgi:nucleotide-binding universal stress UspA family protein